MCIICKDWSLGKITTREAWKNLNEIANPEVSTFEEMQHYWEVAEKLTQEENEKSKI